MAVQFVKYDCGCIGFPPEEDGAAWILDCCDDKEGDLLTFSKRFGMGEKTFKTISQKGFEIMAAKIQKQLGDGERFYELQNILSVEKNGRTWGIIDGPETPHD